MENKTGLNRLIYISHNARMPMRHRPGYRFPVAGENLHVSREGSIWPLWAFFGSKLEGLNVTCLKRPLLDSDGSQDHTLPERVNYSQRTLCNCSICQLVNLPKSHLTKNWHLEISVLTIESVF